MRDWSVPALRPRHAPIPHCDLTRPKRRVWSFPNDSPFTAGGGCTDRAGTQTLAKTPNGPGLYALGHRELATGPTEALVPV
jgi:hypothetical protein